MVLRGGHPPGWAQAGLGVFLALASLHAPELPAAAADLLESAQVRVHDVGSGVVEQGVPQGDGSHLFASLSLALIASREDCRWHGRLINLAAATSPERAVELSLALPVARDGLVWGDDIRRTRAVGAREVFENTMPSSAGREGFVARYPFACVWGETGGIAIANPIDEPRILRLAYDGASQELRATWSLGLSPATAKFPNHARVEAMVFDIDPAWGFRSAAERFIAMQPEAFTVRAPRQGIWMPFTQIDRVDRPEDFGFAFHEYHPNVSIAHNEANSISSLIYTEPVVHWLNLPPGVERTYLGYMGHLATLADAKASSLISSGCFEPNGTFTHGFHVFPWADGARTPTNPDPDVARTPRAPANRFDEEWATISGAPEGNDGAYFDSFEGWEMDRLNHRRDHWAGVDWPLTFDRDGRLAYPNMFHAYEFAREVAARLHPARQLTMANTAPYRFCWTTAWLDVMGIETNWGTGEELNPPPLPERDWVRTLAGAKPYCYLQNVPFDQFRGAKVEGYFEQCLFHGFFPSFFSHDAANDPYWENAALCNEDRAVFLRFLPAIRRVAEAGWRPVTGVRSDNAAVLVERFGERDALHLTLMNTSGSPQRASLSVDPALVTGLGICSAYDLQTLEMLGQTPPTAPGDALMLDVEMAPRQVRAVRLLSEAATFTDGTAASHEASLIARMASESHRGHEAEYVEALWRAAGEAALVRSLRQQLGDGTEVTLQGPRTGLPGQTLRVTGSVSVSDVTLFLAGREVAHAEGDSLAMPAGAARGDVFQLRAQFSSSRAHGVRFFTVRVASPLEISGLPRRVVYRDERALTFEVQNNSGEPQDMAVTVTPPAGLIAEPAAAPLSLAAGERQSVVTLLAADAPGEVSAELVITVRGAGLRAEVSVPVHRLGPEASLTRGDDVVVEVDSVFGGYSARPLNDGVTDTRGVAWDEAAWAAAEAMAPHAATFTFPSPRLIREVTVWWALDGGRLWSSRQFRVDVQRGDGTWVTLAEREDSAPRERDVVAFDPVPALAVRILQPTGGGPPERPGIMWISEVEAR
ncbi:MAG: hypothetical protein HUU25_10470 [Candidatus Sumerlaeia bacterium]|nr:hypothetical protein [Candidatus Sumerlaeia bacterium]